MSWTEILYGPRESHYTWRILEHDYTTGTDHHVGDLAGVDKGNLDWSWFKPVKGSGGLSVLGSGDADARFMSIKDVDLYNARVQPVLSIEGLPDFPLGTFVFTGAPADWTDTGCVHGLQLSDRATILLQNKTTDTFVAGSTRTTLEWVQFLGLEAGERITVDLSDTTSVNREMIWDPGVERLTIINELLEAIDYSKLQVGWNGDLITSPFVPANRRSLMYDLLPGVRRELLDGDTSIYEQTWSRDIDNFEIPNVVVAISTSTGDIPSLIEVVRNENVDYPYSIPRRNGHEITHRLENQEVPEGDEQSQRLVLRTRATQSLLGMSSPAAAIKLRVLPIPIRVGDVVRFRNRAAGPDGLYLVTSIQLTCTDTGRMDLTLQEIVSI